MIWTGAAGVADIGDNILVEGNLVDVRGFANNGDGKECYVVWLDCKTQYRLVPFENVTAMYVKVEL